MNKQITIKLWVTKFCLKLIFPKFNIYAFLVYLAIKFRFKQQRILNGKGMDVYELKTISSQLQRKLLQTHIKDKLLSVLLNKCIIIPQEEFLQLSSENLFYIDSGILWISLKVAPGCQNKYEKGHGNKENSVLKYNLNLSEIHKKLFSHRITGKLSNNRIIPVFGSKYVQQNVALCTEEEYFNIANSFDLSTSEKIEISFHTIDSLDFAPKIAATAEVSLIVNEHDLSNDFVKEVLSNYFEVPKLVSINDVFYIDLTPTITRKYHYKYFDLVESYGKLYFKCRKLYSDNLDNSDDSLNEEKTVIQSNFIVKGITQLSLGEHIHSLKPKNEYFNTQKNVGSSLQLLHSCPTGLREKFEQIQETIYPIMNGKICDLSSFMPNPIIPMLLLTGVLGSGKHLLVKLLAKYNGMNCLELDCNALQSSTAKQTESKINSMIQKAKGASPVIVLLDNFEVFAVDPENNEDCRIVEYFINTITDLYQNYTKHPIIFIAVTEKRELKPNILRLFLEKFHLPLLDAQQRYKMLEWFANTMQLNINSGNMDTPNNTLNVETGFAQDTTDVLKRVAAKTETFLYGNLDTLMHFALRESYLKQHNSYKQLPSMPDLNSVKEADFDLALESIRSLQSQHLDAPKIPKVYWEDIGGLEILKKELSKTIEFPIKYPHLFKNSTLKRSGILLYGPPGCGKTLIAKAVCTELNISFLSVKGPELLNMYIGQSEENVRKVFESARAASPCVVFFDELDALAPRRGAAGDSAGASDRVVSQLLAEMDGVARQDDADVSSFVFVMGATNRPDLLEQSLLRPGRLDKLIYVGPYNGLEEKTSVLRALCRNYKLRPEVELEAVAAALPDRCTGADLLQVVTTARSAAVRNVIDKLQSGIVKESELSTDSIILGISELWQGVESFRPSVADEEMNYYDSLQSQL